MLSSLNLRNFRAFKAHSFGFSKINVFVGPNNSGKSSVVSALNLIAQNFNIPDVTNSPIVLNGQYDNLGTFIDVVHGNRSNTPLGFDFGFGPYTARYDYKYRQQRREIELVRFEFEEKGRNLYSFHSRKDAFSIRIQGQEIELLAPSIRKRRPRFSQLLPISRLAASAYDINSQESLSGEVREKLYLIDRQFSRARSHLRDIFSRFDSISPFRDRPERTYLYSGEVAQKIGNTGTNMALMLSGDASRRGAESRDMIAEISRWFRVAGIADELRIKSLTPRHFEIVLAEGNGSEHNICDVGFGCSQVLPVLAASLNLFGRSEAPVYRGQPILVAQEPEIHLHPNAQAALGSFFVGLLKTGGQLFFETHSDNMILRIARHVADGTLSPEDVRIFYIHKVNGLSTVSNISIDEKGGFFPEWPGGFFPQRQSESLSLAQAAFKARKISESPSQLEFKYPEES